MNYVGTTLVGVLLIFFSLALYKTLKPGWLVTVSSVFLAIGGTAFIIVCFSM